jgi:hypothetical protein
MYSRNYLYEWLGMAVSAESGVRNIYDADQLWNLAPFNTDFYDDGVTFLDPHNPVQGVYEPAQNAATAQLTITVADLSSSRYRGGPDKQLYVIAWADANRNGVFGDARDAVMLRWTGAPGLRGSDGGNWSPSQPFYQPRMSIRIPGETGWMMVRVALRYGDWPTPNSPFDYGEVEDYLIGVFDNAQAPDEPPGPPPPRR